MSDAVNKAVFLFCWITFKKTVDDYFTPVIFVQMSMSSTILWTTEIIAASPGTGTYHLSYICSKYSDNVTQMEVYFSSEHNTVDCHPNTMHIHAIKYWHGRKIKRGMYVFIIFHNFTKISIE